MNHVGTGLLGSLPRSSRRHGRGLGLDGFGFCGTTDEDADCDGADQDELHGRWAQCDDGVRGSRPDPGRVSSGG